MMASGETEGSVIAPPLCFKKLAALLNTTLRKLGGMVTLCRKRLQIRPLEFFET
jgi:hypothetical protein